LEGQQKQARTYQIRGNSNYCTLIVTAHFASRKIMLLLE